MASVPRTRFANQPPPLRPPPSDIPIPTTRRPPQHSQTLRRNKTLTRPERGIAPAPLIAPTAAFTPQARKAAASKADRWTAWTVFCHIVTFWAPPFLLSFLAGLKDKPTRQAWREKVGLCFIALLLGGIIGFLTVGLNRALCPNSLSTNPDKYLRVATTPGMLAAAGRMYDITRSQKVGSIDFGAIATRMSGQDITTLFQRDSRNYPKCRDMKFQAAIDPPCLVNDNKCPIPAMLNDSTIRQLGFKDSGKIAGYDWPQMKELMTLQNYFIIDGAVLNFNDYIFAHPNVIPNDPVDKAIRTMIKSKGKDGTRLFYNRKILMDSVPCLTQRYYAGNIDKITPGCAASGLILYAGLVVILGLVIVRFVMACIFNWFISARLTAPPKNLSRAVVSPAVMPVGANVQMNSKNGTAPWSNKTNNLKKAPPPLPNVGQKMLMKGGPPSARGASPVISLAQIGAELFTVCLITCYSEGEESIRSTLDSISRTSYSDSRKLMFVVCDGMVTGAGEKRSTPDICVGLLEVDPRFGEPVPMSYVAVGLGTKKENKALVYAGHYRVAGRRTPTLVIVKCGTEYEVGEKKPGNRGKRDSQLVLMHFFSRVTYNDRMSPLDFELFRKIQVLMGVTPDFFEACLMVDADTKVHPESITQLVNALHHDVLIMGVCGETRIANKRQSWVTAIQVYEYFISHHLAKAFESVFGGVTCLPGCFSMYRLKARKASDDDWVPLLVNPEIVQEYSQSEVVTLHEKNLLLLGEDRFLTTILLRKFPNRKMMFIPQARCRTIAPDTFSVLLSQRRRWINSTIHNLMELVLVRNLCGTFCFSMQFVVFMDLIGTATLPVAISLTYSLIVSMGLDPPDTFEKAIPLILLISVIGLPAVLILITTRKVVYVFWMLIYLIALPVWNFIMPIYAFWHFDDFSWGETRKVEGEAKGAGHDDGKGTVVVSGTSVPLRRWEDWERSRLRKLKREEKRRRDMARGFPSGPMGPDGEFLAPRPLDLDRFSMADSDTYSLASSADDDVWGEQIGGYDENNVKYPPPPVGLFANPDLMEGGVTLGDGDLEALLESGWDEVVPSPPPMSPRGSERTRTYQPPPLPTPTMTDSMPNSAAPLIQSYSPATTPRGERIASPPSPFRPTNAASSGVAWQSHAKKRSIGRGSGNSPGGYGPLGPLDPDRHS